MSESYYTPVEAANLGYLHLVNEGKELRKFMGWVLIPIASQLQMGDALVYSGYRGDYSAPGKGESTYCIREILSAGMRTTHDRWGHETMKSYLLYRPEVRIRKKFGVSTKPPYEMHEAHSNPLPLP